MFRCEQTLTQAYLDRGSVRWLLLALAILAPRTPLCGQTPAAPTTAGEELFASHVLPIFKEKCFGCHGEDLDDVRGQLNMLTRKGLLQGGESEQPAIVPGQPDSSLVYQAVKWDGLEMPPKENDRLSAQQIQAIGQWISAGAPWPDTDRLQQLQQSITNDPWHPKDGVRVVTSGGLSDDWTNRRYDPQNLWAYQPLPKSVGSYSADLNENPIDRLIDQRLAERPLPAAPPADRRTLIRRATFDLIGLPPTPDEVERFLGDPDSDQRAFAKVVDRLLESPHYGEQWARHWLDVVRYADSSGYANDYERGNAWRYRDYVVRSFNDDKPYDQFIREQVAGDEIDPFNPEMLIAVGFLRMGPWELTGMEVPKIARQRFLDDVTDAVGQVFLAHMLQCARCHDHKFDPVPTRDYYSLQAVFATTQLAERDAPFLPVENTNGFDEEQQLLARIRQYHELLAHVKEKSTIAAARQWYKDNALDATVFEQIAAAEEALARKRGKPVDIAQLRILLAARKVRPEHIFPLKVGFDPEDFGLERIARKGIERMRWRLERYDPIAFSVYSGRTPNLKSVYAPLRMPAGATSTGELEKTCILTGGDPFSPADEVAPSVLSAATPALDAADRAITTKIVGRRRELANWIANPFNPLTPRVMANRVWQWHFGRAIAGNPNNFGATGKKPTHPELLDYLAAQLIQHGWSIKSLHRLIMNSQAYRRSYQHPQPDLLAERDSPGSSYAVFLPRRLDAEELRDAMLHVSGELNTTLGGIPVRPEMNLEAALQPRMVMGTFAEAWQPSPLPADRHRRSLYALKLRGQRDPFQEVFNSPAPEVSCEAREASLVTPQVFAMFNSQITFDRALALASRIHGEQQSPHSAIERLFRLCFSRTPSADELHACLDHWDKMTKRHERLHFDRPSYPTEITRVAVEENTGVRFSYVEPLEDYERFVPDLKPADASPRLRGLAEVCLVLFNSNEFAYVY